MCQGRCAGCGYVGSDARVVVHQASCEGFAEAYRKDPSAILSVQEEYKKWRAEGRRQERAQAHADSVAATDGRRAAMADRFTTRDLLDD
jgi:hypothetical protein